MSEVMRRLSDLFSRVDDPRVVPLRVQVLGLLAVIALLIFILDLVRRRRLDEQYSIVWLGIGLIIAVFVAFRRLQLFLADGIGIYYAPSLVFGLLIFLLLIIALHLSAQVTLLQNRSRIAAQRIAILERHLQLLTKEPAPTDKVES